MIADAEITRARIAEVAATIRPHVRRTPTVDVAAADFGLPGGGAAITFKLELLQRAGSFKSRGAFANLLLRNVPPAGVVAASGGNHGAAVANAARSLGIPAKIFVPEIASPVKVAKIREAGADLSITGALYNDSLRASLRHAEETGALMVHAFDQAETILGQGTLAAELEEQAPDLDTVLVPVGGGGLVSGVASWYDGRVRVVGVEPEGAATLARAFEAGEPVDAPEGSVAADSLAAGRVGTICFEIAKRLVERVVLVSDDEIRASQKAIWKTLQILPEPGGATAFAALLSGRYRPAPGERVGIVVSGGNTGTGPDGAGPLSKPA